MKGMSTGLEANDPTVVSAFHSALVTQGSVILVILGLTGSAWVLLRAFRLSRRAASQADAPAASPRFPFPEPAARRLLRISFGLLWIFDGVLQGQPKMPLGMGPDVIQPLAAASPAWVQHLDNALVTVWSYHPVAAAAAAVWIQVGIGVWLLAAPRGNWSRLAGLASVLWGLNVWVFGEAFGGIFAPGLTWLFGAPGAAVFYCIAGCLIALPESVWTTPRPGRIVLRGVGLFFIGMAVLQAWPGRGFWQGELKPGVVSGTLTSMVKEMSQTPQPHFLASLVSSSGGFIATHGWEVNLFVVIALTAIGATFLTARPSLVRVGVIAGCCALPPRLGADRGPRLLRRRRHRPEQHDPHGPRVRRRLRGAHARARAGERARRERRGPAPAVLAPGRSGCWRIRRMPFARWQPSPRLPITVVGAVPLAVAATEPHAAPIIAEAVDGTPNAVDLPATAFTLVDQHDQPVSLAALRGRTIALTFLDDVCTSDCPVIAQEFRLADGMLGADARRVELVAVDANPRYIAPDYLAAFDRQEGLEGVPNWLYLTGSLAQLTRVWSAYGALVEYSPAGAMIAHSESADVIDANGRIRYILDTDPGPGDRRVQVLLRGHARRSAQECRARFVIEDEMSGQWRRRRCQGGRARVVGVHDHPARGMRLVGPRALPVGRSLDPHPPCNVDSDLRRDLGHGGDGAPGRAAQHLLATPLPTLGQRVMVEPGEGDRRGHERRPRARLARRPRAARRSASHEPAHVFAADLHLRRRAVVVDGTLGRRSRCASRCARGRLGQPHARARERSRGSAGAREHRRPLAVADVGHHACARVHRRRTLVWSVHDHRGRLHDGNPARRCKL